MNKQLCFIIEKQNLYLDKVLVLFNDIPLFFVCHNEDNQRFLVLCTELEKLEYIVVAIGLTNLRNMLSRKKSMRETILKGEKFWKIVSGDTIEDDVCIALGKEEIDYSLLPDEGALYKTVYQEDVDYVGKIELEYLGSIQFDLMDGVNVLVNSIDVLTEGITCVIETMAESLTSVVGYLDIGPSVDSITNGVKKIFANRKIETEVHQKFDYDFKAENVQNDSTLKIKDAIVLDANDSNASLAA